MAAALKLGGQEHLHHALRHVLTGKARADGHHVGIIVAAGHLRLQAVGAVGAADALDLVGSDGNADAGGADHNTAVALALSHSTGSGSAEIRIIAALQRVAAKILVLIAQLFQGLHDKLLQLVAAVITAQCDFHSHFLQIVVFSDDAGSVYTALRQKSILYYSACQTGICFSKVQNRVKPHSFNRACRSRIKRPTCSGLWASVPRVMSSPPSSR